MRGAAARALRRICNTRALFYRRSRGPATHLFGLFLGLGSGATAFRRNALLRMLLFVIYLIRVLELLTRHGSDLRDRNACSSGCMLLLQLYRCLHFI